jgi:hypothetical protein
LRTDSSIEEISIEEIHAGRVEAGPRLTDAAPGDRSRNAVRVSSRYVVARTIAATIVAAYCIGGSIPTSDLVKVRRLPGNAAPWQDQRS